MASAVEVRTQKINEVLRNDEPPLWVSVFVREIFDRVEEDSSLSEQETNFADGKTFSRYCARCGLIDAISSLQLPRTRVRNVAAIVIQCAMRKANAKRTVTERSRDYKHKLELDTAAANQEASVTTVQSLYRRKEAMKEAEQKRRKRVEEVKHETNNATATEEATKRSGGSSSGATCSTCLHPRPPNKSRDNNGSAARPPLAPKKQQQEPRPGLGYWVAESLEEGRPSTTIFRLRPRAHDGRWLNFVLEAAADESQRSEQLSVFGREAVAFFGLRALNEAAMAKKASNPGLYPLLRVRQWTVASAPSLQGPTERVGGSSSRTDMRTGLVYSGLCLPQSEEAQFLSSTPLDRIRRADATCIQQILECSKQQLASLKCRLHARAKIASDLHLDQTMTHSGVRPAELSVVNVSQLRSYSVPPMSESPASRHQSEQFSATAVPHRIPPGMMEAKHQMRLHERNENALRLKQEEAEEAQRLERLEARKERDRHRQEMLAVGSRMTWGHRPVGRNRSKQPKLRGEFAIDFEPMDNEEAVAIAQRKHHYLNEIMRHHRSLRRTI